MTRHIQQCCCQKNIKEEIMDKLFCKTCGEKLSSEDVFEFEGKIMCRQCFERDTAVCSLCGERIWAIDNEGTSSIILCNSCYENHYTHCEECGALLNLDNAYYEDDSDYPYCRSCYESIFNGTIHSYCYKPEPIFYGENNLYLGIELEIDCGGENGNNAEDIVRPANMNSEHVYCKHDGSLCEGFEIVSHPMDIDYHKEEMPWDKVMDKAISLGYRSHQTSTCGLHIHVSRNGLGETYTQQEDVISRIVYFIEAHWNELLKFSRRTESSINRWASRYGLSESTKTTYDKAKKGNGMGRYVCLNLNNANTIEFRIFRGTLKYETFIAALELVHEICIRAISMTDEEFEHMCWSDFVRDIDKENKPSLINYLKSKQLYINELNESEGDI